MNDTAFDVRLKNAEKNEDKLILELLDKLSSRGWSVTLAIGNDNEDRYYGIGKVLIQKYLSCNLRNGLISLEKRNG